MLRLVFPYLEGGLTIQASPRVVWDLLVDTSRWVEWGPSIRSVHCSERILTRRSSGRVQTILGFTLPFAVTRFVEGKLWAWRVLGVPATTHTLDDLGQGRCRLWFGVPIAAFPYLLVALIAIRRIARLAETRRDPASVP